MCSDSGGEEVLLDVGGQDATEAFEDVGHSDEAREQLVALEVGLLKRQVRVPLYPELQSSSDPEADITLLSDQAGDPAPKVSSAPSTATASTDAAGLGVGLYAFLLLGGVVAFGAYQYLQAQQAKA